MKVSPGCPKLEKNLDFDGLDWNGDPVIEGSKNDNHTNGLPGQHHGFSFLIKVDPLFGFPEKYSCFRSQEFFT